MSTRAEAPAAQRPAVTSGSDSPAPVAVTSGEPAGIGPEICLALGESPLAARVVVLGDREMLEVRARQLGIRMTLREPGSRGAPGSIACLHLPLSYRCRPGVLDPRSAPYVISLLDRAVAGCRTGEFAALVTAPVHKGIINDGGMAYPLPPPSSPICAAAGITRTTPARNQKNRSR